MLRINKLLSNGGYCSRTEANQWIRQRRVLVNGQLCQEGQWISSTDEILIDGAAFKEKPKLYYLFHKPVGIECTLASDRKDGLWQFLKDFPYLYPVGRLDKASEGLLLLTNDGKLANEILRHEHGIEKEYYVEVTKELPRGFSMALSEGVDIGGYVTKPCQIILNSPRTFTITLTEGKNRQIRRMCGRFGLEVSTLKRIRIGPWQLGALGPGDLVALDIDTSKINEYTQY